MVNSILLLTIDVGPLIEPSYHRGVQQWTCLSIISRDLTARMILVMHHLEMFTWAVREVWVELVPARCRLPTSKPLPLINKWSNPPLTIWTARELMTKKCWSNRTHSFWTSKGTSNNFRHQTSNKNLISKLMRRKLLSQLSRGNSIKSNTRIMLSREEIWRCKKHKTVKWRWSVTWQEWIRMLCSGRSLSCKWRKITSKLKRFAQTSNSNKIKNECRQLVKTYSIWGEVKYPT